MFNEMFDLLGNLFQGKIDLNGIVGMYDALMAKLAAISLVISLLGWVLNKIGIIPTDKDNGMNFILVVDIALFVMSIFTMFVTIPKGLYIVLLILCIFELIAVPASLLAKIGCAFIFLIVSIQFLTQGDFLFFVFGIILTALILLAALVNAAHILLTFNDVLSIIRAF